MAVRIALLAATTVFLTVASAQNAEVYRSVEPDGTVSYSDRPTDANAETILIVAPRPATPPPAPASPTQSQTSTEATAPSDAAAESEEPPPPTPEEVAAQRAENCEIARERDARYQMSRRLFRPLPSGEREYLSDAEIDEAKAQAAADVEKWCN